MKAFQIVQQMISLKMVSGTSYWYDPLRLHSMIHGSIESIEIFSDANNDGKRNSLVSSLAKWLKGALSNVTQLSSVSHGSIRSLNASSN